MICVYTYNRALFSLKRKETLSHAATWKNLEDSLSEISQSHKKTKTMDSPSKRHLKQSNSLKQSRMVDYQGLEREGGEKGSYCSTGTDFQLCKMKKLCRSVSQQYKYTENY